VLHLWLEDLKATEVDLEAYGQAERQMHPTGTLTSNFAQLQKGGEAERPSVDIIGFSFGPNPEDWRVWVSGPTDAYALEFWDWIDAVYGIELAYSVVLTLPCSWVEEEVV
jgi:hypothetical protein